jgi:hypothetical protein
MRRENHTVVRVVTLLVALVLLSGWVMPAHACTETKHMATMHCAEVDEFETSALLVRDGAFIFWPLIVTGSMSQLTLIPQLLVFTIYRPPQA